MIARHAKLTAALALMAGGAQADTTVTLLHTNDFHARFAPFDGSGTACAAPDDAAGECFGGAARLATAIAAARARHGTTLLVDSGDRFGGQPLRAAKMMNRLGYDAMAVGNHEFDDGPEALSAFAQATDFPILMSNADIPEESALWDAIGKSVVVERDGARIGLIGLTPEDTGELANPGPDIAFTDPVAAVRAEVGRLTAEGVDKIVVLSHSGYRLDQRIARKVAGIDVIVGGHSHTLLGDMAGAAGPYPTMVGDTAIVQAGAYGKYLGALTVTFDEAGRVTRTAGRPILLDAGIAEDAATPRPSD